MLDPEPLASERNLEAGVAGLLGLCVEDAGLVERAVVELDGPAFVHRCLV